MTSRFARFFRRFLIASSLVCMFAVLPAGADVNVWYEIMNGSDDADGITVVSQGASGEPLIITLDPKNESYELVIMCKASITEDDAVIGYAIDLSAPDDSIVSSVVDEFAYLSPFGYYLPPTFATGPGEIIAGAAEFGLEGHYGDMTLFSFILRVNGEVDHDVNIYSGIGDFLWADFANLGVEIQFADSEPLDGEIDGLVSNTPSIVLQAVGGSGEPGDCNGNEVPDEDEISSDPSLDCNSNGVLDECDIADGTSHDCNDNGVPDECDLGTAQSLDCDENGIPDECDIADGTSQDCNENGIPDSCDIASEASLDCNSNGVLDNCELANGDVADCNANQVPDVCEIAIGSVTDCNSNGVPDECDIPDGNSADCNGNGVPDECDIASGVSADADGNGIPDECVRPSEQEQPDDNGTGKVVDREQLRSFLMLLFNIPGEGQAPLSAAPLHFFSYFGVPMSAAMMMMETISLPARAMMFAFTYVVMDAFLP